MDDGLAIILLVIPFLRFHQNKFSYYLVKRRSVWTLDLRAGRVNKCGFLRVKESEYFAGLGG